MSLAAAWWAVANPQAAETNPAPTTAPTRDPATDAANEIVARGKGVSVKRRQVNEALATLKKSAEAQGQTIPDAEREKVEEGVLDRLVMTQLLVGKATADDKSKAKELADQVAGRYRDQARTPERFAAQLKAMGVSEEAFRTQVLDQAICEQVLDRELRSKLTITEDQVKQFYAANEGQFQEPEKVRAAHILIATQDLATGQNLPEPKVKEKQELAQKALARARSGEDFAKLVKEYSEDPGSKDSGGEYTFPRGEMVPEFETAAFSMKTNQISDLVATQYGFHIIKLNEKMPARKVELAKVEKDIRAYLANREVEKQLPGYLDKLKADAGVEIVGAKAKPQP